MSSSRSRHVFLRQRPSHHVIVFSRARTCVRRGGKGRHDVAVAEVAVAAAEERRPVVDVALGRLPVLAQQRRAFIDAASLQLAHVELRVARVSPQAVWPVLGATFLRAAVAFDGPCKNTTKPRWSSSYFPNPKE